MCWRILKLWLQIVIFHRIVIWILFTLYAQNKAVEMHYNPIWHRLTATNYNAWSCIRDSETMRKYLTDNLVWLFYVDPSGWVQPLTVVTRGPVCDAFWFG
jgi:hypothetical protein